MAHSVGNRIYFTRRSLIIYGTLVLFTASILYVGFGAAKTRKESLFEFLKDNQVPSGGFQDSNASGTYTTTPFAGFASIYTMDKLGMLDKMSDKVQAENFYKGRFSTAVTEQNVPDMYYSYKCLSLLGASAEVNDTTEAGKMLLKFRNNQTHGFKSFGDASESMTMTFFAVEFLSESSVWFPSAENVTLFIQSCWDASTGAFAGKSDLS